MSVLLRQAGRFEGFGLILEHPKASDPPVLDCEHERAPRDHLDALAPRTWAVFGTTTSEPTSVKP